MTFSRYLLIREKALLLNELTMMMGSVNQTKRSVWRRFKITFVTAFALCISACAGATRPPDAAGPRPNEPPYPVLLTASEDRSAASLAAWSALMKAQGIANANAPELDPVTGTISKLPALPFGASLYLPKVGTAMPMSEEETRESLRRFIENETRLIGATPQQLSLVDRADTNSNTKTARYEQRPFRYALRAGYGVLQIEFAPDGKLLQLSSTCIPEIENLQRAGTGLRPRYTAEEVAQKLVGRSFALTNGAASNNLNVNTNGNVNTNSNANERNKSAGTDQFAFAIAASDEVQVRELVVYPRPRKTEPRALEFHLAWEIRVTRGAEKYLVYLDAITDEFIAATPDV